MKKLLLIICGLILALGAYAAVDDTFTENQITYKVTKEESSDKEVTVIGVTMFSATVEIPATVTHIKYSPTITTTTYNVTAINQEAFKGNTYLETLKLNANVKIGDSSFENCTKLAAITNSEKITSIGNSAFAYCSALTSLSFTGVNTIGDHAFNKSGLTKITIPSGTSSLGAHAFDACAALTTATINASITAIPEGLFQNCTLLNTVNVKALTSCTTIGNYAFSECKALKSFGLDSLTTLTSIGDNAFAGSGLQSIQFPVKVTATGFQAFQNCKSLTKVELGSGVTTIDAQSFYCCTALGSVTIPSGVTSIGGSAFQGCTNLGDVSIPSSVTSVGAQAFLGCTSMKKAIIFIDSSNSGQQDSRADADATATIGEKAFLDCNILGELVLGPNTASIGDYAFNTDNKYALKNVYSFNPMPPTLGNDVFGGSVTNESVLHVPNGSETDYKTATGWNIFNSHVVGIDNIIVDDDNSNGLQGISDADSAHAARYYDLCGKPVHDISAPGLYIRQCGGKASKVLVK